MKSPATNLLLKGTGLITAALLLLALSACKEESGPSFTDSNTGPFLISTEQLDKTARLAKSDPLFAEELQTMIDGAEMFTNYDFEFVTDKEQLPPSGDRKDYMSLHRYAWPDEDGNYTIIRDGQTNPEIYDYDAPRLTRMATGVYALSMGYYFTGDERYAERAANLLKGWFLDPETGMNPHMNYAGIRPGVDETGGGVINANNFIRVIDAVSLIYDSPHWTGENHYELKSWFYQFNRWMQIRFGPDFNRQSNVATWLDVQRAIYLLFIEEDGKLNSSSRLMPMRDRVDDHFSAIGFQAHEANRAISQHYVYYNLRAYVKLATLRKNQYNRSGSDRDWEWLLSCIENECSNPGLIRALDDLAETILESRDSQFFTRDESFNRRRYLEVFLPASLLFDKQEYREAARTILNAGYRHPDVTLAFPLE